MNWTRLATVATTALCVAAVPALAQNVPVRILQPAPEQVVRGQVPIAINAAAVPPTGYMQVEINDAFVAAVSPTPGSSTVRYVWDTRSNFPGTNEPPRDGQYTIRVKTYTNRFEFVRSNELNVYVRNHIGVPADKTFRLGWKFSPDETLNITESVDATAAGQPVYSAVVPVTLEVNDVFNGVAEAREKVSRDAAERVSGTRQPMAIAGRSFLVQLYPNGRVAPGRRMQRAGASPVISMLNFPTKPLHVGDTWTSDITIHPFYNGVLSATIAGTNKLAGFEYYHGRPAARIESTYDGTAKVSTTTGAATGIPGVPGGPPVPGATGAEGAPITFRGKRVTWFDHVNGRLLRSEDTLTADFNAAAGVPGGPPVPGGYPGADSSGSGVNIRIVTTAQ